MARAGIHHAEELIDKLSQRIDGYMGPFGWLLVPPFSDVLMDPLLDFIRKELKADAASLFLTEDGAPHQLKCASCVGYKQEYREKVYYLNQPALTSHVFSTKTAISMHARELEPLRQKGRNRSVVPFSGQCKDYIDTAEFRNIVAVPVVFEKNAIGVLKLENKKGKGDSEHFPPEDFALAKIVAHMIAIACQQRIYTQLWNEGEKIAASSETIDIYLNRVTDILRKALNAECCSIFVEDKQSRVSAASVLRYGGGVGYTEAYSDHTYSLTDGEKQTALTSYIAQLRIKVCDNEKRLKESGMPYSGKCRDFIRSGTFRNLLGIALVESESSFGKRHAPCWGVLKLENRNPEGTDFGNYDFEVCKAFVIKQIVPTLKRLERAPRRQKSSESGFEMLVRELGTSVSRHDAGWDDRLEKVLLAQQKRSGITNDDCAMYLKLSRATYCRRKEEWKAEREYKNYSL